MTAAFLRFVPDEVDDLVPFPTGEVTPVAWEGEPRP